MKKSLIFTSLVIICLASMSFRGCSTGFFDSVSFAIYNTAGAQYDYFGNSAAVIFYNISVGDNGTILRTQGTNNFVFNQIPSGTTQRLNDIRTSNNPYQDEAAICGNNGTVLVSGNSGLNWTLKTPVTGANLYGVDHSYYLYAVGDNGTILYANEIITGSLVSRPSGTTRNLRAVTISISNNQRVVVVGEKGTILRTMNGGLNWDNVSIPDTTFNFNSLSKKSIYYPTDIFVAVGSGGRIYKSTDIGATWQQKTSGTTNNLRSVYFASPDSGVVVGDNGTVRFTTNGGETWFTNAFFNSPSSRHYRSVSLVYRNNKTFTALSDTMFFVSEEPLTVGINHLSSEIPDNYSLSQNFPNPFNPTTNIKFAISKAGFVKLTVFDMLGREVETLVNENLNAGTYNADWNASNYPSGVYFYMIETEGFTETKKMLILK
ncbi:MAG: T9SS type A sorting domain-containing protein [Ignavibacteria bacterium]|nr:T9SS type A sorting domain-containing protein [Ignavibacteria bacterium]